MKINPFLIPESERATVLCVFDPEHDICLAHGGCDFMAPKMALEFARHSSSVMEEIYGKGIVCRDAYGLESYQGKVQPLRVIAWGWNPALRKTLLKKGLDESLLPSETEIMEVRKLSHRSTILPFQEFVSSQIGMTFDTMRVTSVTEVEEILKKMPEVVMKAPWSGSGRGVRWVSRSLSDHDKGWIKNVVEKQDCVMVEGRKKVVKDFALEFYISQEVDFVGYSLFNTVNGAYVDNELINDQEFREEFGLYLDLSILDEITCLLLNYMERHYVGKYCGPLGVDMFIYQVEDSFRLQPLVELNFRHTMGLVAHEVLRNHPEKWHERWKPELF